MTGQRANTLKFDSNYCLDSLVIRLLSKDLKTPYPKNRTPYYRVSIYTQSLAMDPMCTCRGNNPLHMLQLTFSICPSTDPCLFTKIRTRLHTNG